MKWEQLNKYIGFPTMGTIEAMQKIDENAKGLLFIIDEDKRLLGTVTDGDIRRWIIKTGDLTSAVSVYMNSKPKFIYRENREDAQLFMRQKKIKALPVLNTHDKICDLVFLSEDSEDVSVDNIDGLKDVPVIIMAGGRGTRLYPFTNILPKPLIPIGEVPIMERIIGRFVDCGVKEFYATVNYLKNMIISYFAEKKDSYRINYIEESKPLGTAGSLSLIDKPFDKPFFVTNCDILIQADYSDVYKYHIESKNDITMVVALKRIVIPYGVVKTSGQGVVSSIEEKPKLSYFINTGMYVLNPEILKEIPRDTFYHMTDLTDRLLAAGRKVGMYPISEDSFLDMGEFEELKRMEEKLSGK